MSKVLHPFFTGLRLVVAQRADSLQPAFTQGFLVKCHYYGQVSLKCYWTIETCQTSAIQLSLIFSFTQVC